MREQQVQGDKKCPQGTLSCLVSFEYKLGGKEKRGGAGKVGLHRVLSYRISPFR